MYSYQYALTTSLHYKVRTLIATIAEKLSSSSFSLDAQAIGNALYGKKMG